jgi:hypothetical protein
LRIKMRRTKWRYLVDFHRLPTAKMSNSKWPTVKMADCQNVDFKMATSKWQTSTLATVKMSTSKWLTCHNVNFKRPTVKMSTSKWETSKYGQTSLRVVHNSRL